MFEGKQSPTERMDRLVHALLHLAHEMREDREQRKHENVILKRLTEMESNIMATQAEVAADLKTANAQLRKLVADTAAIQPAVDALKAKIVELEALVAAGGAVGPELVEAVAETKALAQSVDDNVPEQVPPVV